MKVVVFGFGVNGKKLVQECIAYECGIEIVAIADNKIIEQSFCNIPIVLPEMIRELEYDEIWIVTVYFREIKCQLLKMGLPEDKIFYMEPVLPILEYRLMKDNSIADNYTELMENIKKHHLRMINYDFSDEYFDITRPIYYDSDSALYFGMYKGKKMYLSSDFDTEEKARMYINAVTMEQDSRSPHCYFNHMSIREQKGIAVDVGAAEGIYGLEIIDQIEHLFLFEAESKWIAALEQTFKDYMDKVTIKKGFVGMGTNIRLDDALRDVSVDTIKMDIEGGEMDALEGAEELLKKRNIHLAVCTYHHKNDNDKITSYLNHLGYQTNNSDGVVVCCGDWELENDEVGFRKALVFADK